MLRGVNKQIIEVRDTGSRYFERALLFVRPEFSEMRPGQLELEANKYLAAVGRPPAAQADKRPAGQPDGPVRKPTPSYAARLARVRRRRRLLAAGALGLLLTAAALALAYLL